MVRAGEPIFPSSVSRALITTVKDFFEIVVVVEAYGGIARSDSPNSAEASDTTGIEFELDLDAD